MGHKIIEIAQKIFEDKDRSENYKNALKIIENNVQFAQMFWDHDGIPIILVQELIISYPAVTSEKLNEIECNNLCIVLNIFQVILKNKQIKEFFIEANIIYYLYPFLNTAVKSKQYENLRIASLGAIATLLEINDVNTIRYIKNTEIVPLILRILDIGSEVSKIVALHVFIKIIDTFEGIEYVCQTFDRFIAISVILNSVLYQCAATPSAKLLEYILDCFTKLAKKENVKQLYRNKKPEALACHEIKKQIENDNLLTKKYETFVKSILT
ncbi:Cell differentiation protein RCD1 [Gurleya vavrai]